MRRLTLWGMDLVAGSESMSMLSLLTLIGIFPIPCTASVWKYILCSFAIFPISRMGWMVPISLLTAMTLMSVVCGVMAASTEAGLTMP